VSPSDQPVEIRLTLSREEAVTFLENLATDDEFRRRFEANPREVLAENGIEVTPPAAISATAVAPDPVEIESAIAQLHAPTPRSPWNIMARSAPLVALLAKPEKAAEYETT
jgi:putative modified peptide